MSTTAVSSTNDLALERRRRIAGALAEGMAAWESRSRLRQRVADVLNEDYARDLDRIIATELAHAVNEGMRAELVERLGDDVEVVVDLSPTACRHCRRLYLGADGQPRRFRAIEIPDNSVNWRVKAAQWVPTVPPLHPWCMCTLRLAPPSPARISSGGHQ